MKKHTAQGLTFLGVSILIGLAIFAALHFSWKSSEPNSNASNAMADNLMADVPEAPTPIDLSGYVGQLPTSSISGSTIMNLPIVHASLVNALGEAQLVRLSRFRWSMPIGTSGDRLWLQGCRGIGCADQVVLLIARDGMNTGVCFQDSSPKGDGRGYWYAGGRLLEKADACPAGDGMENDTDADIDESAGDTPQLAGDKPQPADENGM